MNQNQKNIERIVIIAGLVLVLFWWLSDTEFLQFVDSPIEISITGFEAFALAILILFEMIPTVLKQVWSVGAISTQLILTGFSPIILGVLLAVGQLIGQMILYGIGMFAKHLSGESVAKLADKNHFLHKHHFLIYLGVPFIPVLGEGIMLASGHQRINPMKIIPFLFISNLADNYKHIYQTVINLEIGEALA